jgi:hypothetical protein
MRSRVRVCGISTALQEKRKFQASVRRKGTLAVVTESCFTALPVNEERIMAKGSMKAKKEVRKPKKDAKKPAAAPVLKAPAVAAFKQKEK